MDGGRFARRMRILMMLLALAGLHAGAAQATGSGYGGGYGGYGGGYGGYGGGSGSSEDVYQSLDGKLEFSDLHFIGIDPDDVTIEVGESSITFSGDVSISGYGWDHFRIGYTVRTLTDDEIIATGLDLESEVAGTGAVFATKKILAPRMRHPWGPMVTVPDWEREGERGRSAPRARGHGKTPYGRDDHGWKRRRGPKFEPIGTLLAFNIASGWICGCGHHHDRIEDVENECRIERDSDSIEYDGETMLKILDTVKLVSFGKSGAHWQSVTNSYLVTPEPGTAGLLGIGLVGLLLARRRRRP